MVLHTLRDISANFEALAHHRRASNCACKRIFQVSKFHKREGFDRCDRMFYARKQDCGDTNNFAHILLNNVRSLDRAERVAYRWAYQPRRAWKDGLFECSFWLVRAACSPRVLCLQSDHHVDCLILEHKIQNELIGFTGNAHVNVFSVGARGEKPWCSWSK